MFNYSWKVFVPPVTTGTPGPFREGSLYPGLGD